MVAFATPAELASYLQVDSVDTASATLDLDIASKAIRDHCGWTISQETVTAKVLDSHGERSIWLPTLLLTSVGPVLEGTTALVADVDYDWTTYGRLIRAGRWPNRARSVTVTYTHGHAAVPDSVKGVCLAAAGRRYQNPSMARSYTVGGVSESYAITSTGSLGLLLEDERLELGPYRLEYGG